MAPMPQVVLLPLSNLLLPPSNLLLMPGATVSMSGGMSGMSHHGIMAHGMTMTMAMPDGVQAVGAPVGTRDDAGTV